MEIPSSNQKTERHYIAVVIEKGKLKETGVSLDDLSSQIESRCKECAIPIQRGRDIGVPRSDRFGFWIADLRIGLLATELVVLQSKIAPFAKIGHYQEDIWRTVWPVSSKPFANHFFISDRKRASRFLRWLGGGAMSALLAFVIVVAAFWRLAPWITIPTVVVTAGFLLRLTARSWREIKKWPR